jgi:regulatory protein
VDALDGEPMSSGESRKPDLAVWSTAAAVAGEAQSVPRHARGRHQPNASQSGRPGHFAADRSGPLDRGIDASPDPSGDDGPPDPPIYETLFETGTPPRKARRERAPATALQRALGLLTRREHSRKELTRKLVTRGVDATEVDAAIGKLTDGGWQDDGRFAEALVRSRASNGYGPLHIRAELATHDLPAELRQAALDDFEGDWLEIARDVVRRRFERIQDLRVRERKAADYLIRRGFPGDIVRAATRFGPGD